MLLRNHLSVQWLRPESALWDAIASAILSRHEITSPSLDLGCGNGIFSFISAGGNFSIEYDWYRNVDVEDFWENKDIYNVCNQNDISDFITDKPRYRFDVGLDHKSNLLDQAKLLGLYGSTVVHDANQPLPFEEETFQTIFSNILYWLNDPETSLREIHRVLKKGGRAVLCITNTPFFENCPSYKWAEENDTLLKMLNRGRSESHKWTISDEDFRGIAESTGFTVVDHTTYLSPLTLLFWDVGLRPISPYLIRMVSKLGTEDRNSIKAEWVDKMTELCAPMMEKDFASGVEGGFHFYVIEKQ